MAVISEPSEMENSTDLGPPLTNSEPIQIIDGVSKRILDPGSGETMPAKHSSCFVHYRAWVKADGSRIEDTWLENHPVEIVIGQEKPHLKGLSLALQSMTPGERSLVEVSAELAYGQQGSFSFPFVPQNADLVYECQLIGLQSPNETRPRGDMTVEERIAAADRRRIDGNDFFKKGETKEAIQQYEMALGYMGEEFMFQMYGKYRDMADAVRIPVILNLAQCQVKLEGFEQAIVYCNMVLSEDEKNVKALFRRGKARAKLGQLDLAKEDLLKAKKIAPMDRAIVDELQKIRTSEVDLLESQKKVFKGIFEKKEIVKPKSWFTYFSQLFVDLWNYFVFRGRVIHGKKD